MAYQLRAHPGDWREGIEMEGVMQKNGQQAEVETLVLDPARHSLFIGGQKLPGVTSIQMEVRSEQCCELELHRDSDHLAQAGSQ
ncbi:hypothetical protein COBRASIX_13 [Enterobacter phage vB_EclS_CobraSix]|uniref:Uncharacterized protein n=1 Tax=Enterobacter phage vB_EclS_CobraSix TaxID=2894794 RepID=A0AAE9CAT1_9CAUD|nr:hypothetical protein PQD12_gp13 [Enterobacter phage vB_EclS_CobraSix]UGO47180.1 hypothetical protein COBRASIX_13 [Enterobacter phage vB_EclS_CobraSix]